MRVVDGSDPDAVPRDEANRLLAEATVLARTPCRELLVATNAVDDRPRAATRLLRGREKSQEGRPLSELRDSGELQHPATGVSQIGELEATVPVIATYMKLLTADSVDFNRTEKSSFASPPTGVSDPRPVRTDLRLTDCPRSASLVH